MARLRDVPVAFRAVRPWMFAKRLWEQIQEDALLVWAAAMAYSWLFAIFPFLIFLLTLVPYLPAATRADAREEITDLVYRTLPDEAAETVQENVGTVLEQPRGGLLSIGIIVTIWVASGGMSMTMAALNKCYGVEAQRPFVTERAIAIGLTVAVAILVLLVLVLVPIGNVITMYLVQWFENQGVLITRPLLLAWNIGRWSLAVLCMLLVVATIYYFGATRVRHNFRLFSPGAIFSIIAWVLLGLGFGYYIDHYARYDLMYGAVGGVVILLMLFYLYSLVLLMGAEINSMIDYVIRGEPEGASDPETAPAVGEK